MLDVLNQGNKTIKERTCFEARLEHLPISCNDRLSHFISVGPTVRFAARHLHRRPVPLRLDYLSVSTSTPGSFCPDKNSSDAPPPVEMWVIFESMPDCATAEA